MKCPECNEEMEQDDGIAFMFNLFDNRDYKYCSNPKCKFVGILRRYTRQIKKKQEKEIGI